MRRKTSDSASAKTRALMQRGAFTLLELLLVVLIMGIVYGLAVNAIKRYGERSFELSLETLPQYLQSFHQQNHVVLLCTDACRECRVMVDGSEVKKVDPFIDGPLRAYRFDSALGTRELSFTPYYDEDEREFEVCLRFELFPNGSSSEMIIEQEGYVVDFPGYFGTPRRFATLEEAVEYKRSVIKKAIE
jgi:prepilin-type N-terminal cleavage/methylation domain-containing protein